MNNESNASLALLQEFDKDNCKLVKNTLLSLAIATIISVFLISGLQQHMWGAVINIAITQSILVFVIIFSDKQIVRRDIFIHVLAVIMIIDIYYTGYIYRGNGDFLLSYITLFLPPIVSIISSNKYVNIYTSIACGIPLILLLALPIDPSLEVFKVQMKNVFIVYLMATILVYVINAMYRKNIDKVLIMNNEVIKKQSDLETIIDTAKNSAAAVTRIANELNIGNQDLSQRTQEQAASLEETSSAIEEFSSTVKLNADNALKANQMSLKSKEMVIKGNDILRNTIASMEQVTGSSKKISEIIGVVNEIAFQTNLLALNAAVEAARAGEQGRGFAVVAVEVRNLAGRSAQAAKEIQNLINDSVEKIQNSNNLVINTGENLSMITESVETVATLISEISTASREQSLGIEEVNRAISQMDQVTQQNASLVEQSAASSQMMSNEAQELFDIVEKFRV